MLLGGTGPIQTIRPRGLMVVKELGEAARVRTILCLRPHVELSRVGMLRGGRLMQRGDTPVVAEQGRLRAGVQGQMLLRQRVGSQVRVGMGQEMVGWLMLHELAREGGFVVGVVKWLGF